MSPTAIFVLKLVAGILLINAVVWALIIIFVWNRYGPKPAALVGTEKPERALDGKIPGYYFETQTAAGRIFRGWGFLSRGNGVFYLGARGVNFLRHMTKVPLFVPFNVIKSVAVGPSGKSRTGRLPMLHIHWLWEDRELISLICVSRDEKDSQAWADKISKYCV